MNLYSLAHDLGQPLYIIEQMPKSELDGWMQFYSQKAEGTVDPNKPKNLLDDPNNLLAGMLNLGS